MRSVWRLGRAGFIWGRPEEYDWTLGLRFAKNGVCVHLVWWLFGVVWFEREHLRNLKEVA